ncbi:subunit 17 of mediator complex-domain-containing protein [Lentinula aciculospora]|uniref:Mediator of RNA polymerase II transcription subunit 17 n=1 Tax=Lentinula aciculospora TaxID=153920 RepID=A0A9W9DP22_9AGAR|nr:subunit 17 of mediator complex-domain-containing protein [Lentinula aciculospora]
MEPKWKQTKLSLERPYKNDNGEPIPVLYDITPDGVLHYEPKETPTEVLGRNLQRIFEERGLDFFERLKDGSLQSDVLPSIDAADKQEDESKDATSDDEGGHTMTKDELYTLKIEVMPQLYIALGEMTLARDLLSSILASSNASSTALPSILHSITAPEPQQLQPEYFPPLSATLVTKPSSIVSVQAFDAQLAIGGKDEALRKAAGLFKSVATRMELGRLQNEKYWVDALKIRRGNWGLVPASLPPGSATGKVADKTSKDFVVSYGLEESPPIFRRNAIAHMAYGGSEDESLVLPQRSNVRLRISIGSPDASGNIVYSQNALTVQPDVEGHKPSLDERLKTAQRAIIEQEIFSVLVHEAGTFPTASARVSERLVLVDVTQGMELKFELVDADLFALKTSSAQNPVNQAKSDFIYHYLLTLLLRRHAYIKSRRLGTNFSSNTDTLSLDASQTNLPLLQPVIDQLQYQVFCERIHSQLNVVKAALTATGIPSTLRFDPVGEIGNELIEIPIDNDARPLSGACTLRIDNRHNLRLTLVSPSALTAHLSQATISISSMPQLCELLSDEVERFFLERICEVGRRICNDMGGIWFVDLNRCVGRWEGCVLNFQITFGDKFKIICIATQLSRSDPKHPVVDTYDASDTEKGLLEWVQHVLGRALNE